MALKSSIIVAGGYGSGPYLSSVEILDEGSNEWQTGHEQPFGIYGFQMVEDQNGAVVLIGGAHRQLEILTLSTSSWRPGCCFDQDGAEDENWKKFPYSHCGS